jgi:hypothetical protein
VTRRRKLAIVLALLGFVVVAWWPAQPSSADCVTPTLTVSPASGPPGSPVTISGSNWYEGCYDPSSPAATYQGAPPPRTDSDINITFSDGRTTFPIARVTPAGNGSFSFQANVPDGAQPGNGSFRADGANGTPVADFSVGQKPPTPPPTQPAPATTARPANTATTARASSSANVAGSSSGSASRPASDFGVVTPNVPNISTNSTVFFNPSTPLAPQVTSSPGQYFATSASPNLASPPVTLAQSGKSRADVWWVLGFLGVGLAAGVGYFFYQRNQRGAWRPRGF